MRRFADAARLIERYLELHPGLELANEVNLHFHAAQCQALAGDKEQALTHLAASRHEQETSGGLLWNDYVAGTEAFLSGNHPTSIVAHEKLAKGNSVKKPNLAVLDRLLAHFGKSYAEAYDTEGQDHKKLSADCFNRVWELLDKKARTKEDDERYGGLCLRVSGKEPPFYLAYAHEALASAALLNERRELFDHHLAEARKLVAQVTDADEKKMLEDDLAGLQWR